MSHPIKQYREAHGLTQLELAELLGVSRPLIGHIENGEKVVKAEVAPVWESILGIPRHELRPDLWPSN